MTRIHDRYTGNRGGTFKGTRDELVGGEYLGNTAQPHLFRNGDILTAVSFGNHSDYYYDPCLRIPGEHYVYHQPYSTVHSSPWVKLNTKDVPA